MNINTFILRYHIILIPLQRKPNKSGAYKLK